MNSLTILPTATGQRQLDSSCAKLIRAAEIECSAFMLATEQLFGKAMALRAGGLWVDALETDSGFRCQKSRLRLVTILAAARLADLIGATRLIEHSAIAKPKVLTKLTSKSTPTAAFIDHGHKPSSTGLEIRCPRC